MFYLTNEKNEIVGYSTACVNPEMKETNEEIIEVGNKMFFASQTKEIEKAKVEQKRIDEINFQIFELKDQLSATDYKCLKYIDGALSDSEYAEVKAYRAKLREQINKLEDSL